MTRVLVVDDKEENVYYLQALLGAHHFEVQTARHGAEALALARISPPDVIISDLLMPVMDGYTLLRHWKADAALCRVPFIVYTATYTEPEDEQLAMNLGADAFILKPSEPEAFLSRLDEVRRRAISGIPQRPSRPIDDESETFERYSKALIRKLEQKSLELEAANERLRADIVARELAELRLRRAEEQLHQSQKLDALGRLAGGVAHDFNNLLTVILSYATLVLGDLEPGHPVRPDVEEIQHAGERATELTKQLLAFTRQQIRKPSIVGLRDVVCDMEKMLRRLLGADVTLTLLMTHASGNVDADRNQLEQVVLNLTVNARDAMPEGGQLTIETSDVEFHEPCASDLSGVVAGPYVMLSVRDTGVGMDEATHQRIFEPFFTTKEIGKGTGLGLSTVFGIVRQNGGHVCVESELGIGTTFKVYLPRADAAPRYEATPEQPRLPSGGPETILLVDDDEHVRTAHSVILRRNGYTVLEATNAGEAFLVSEQFAGPIELLLTDVVMPRMRGRELARRLALTRESMRVLYVSGYADDSFVHHGVLDTGIAFLAKPTTPDTLLRKVREVLDAPPSE